MLSIAAGVMYIKDLVLVSKFTLIWMRAAGLVCMVDQEYNCV